MPHNPLAQFRSKDAPKPGAIEAEKPAADKPEPEPAAEMETVTCPKCGHEFNPTEIEDVEKAEEKVAPGIHEKAEGYLSKMK